MAEIGYELGKYGLEGKGFILHICVKSRISASNQFSKDWQMTDRYYRKLGNRRTFVLKDFTEGRTAFNGSSIFKNLALKPI
jgi:hypothetical protein